ncbi:DUF6221 family protein [Cellulosimicrobium cellulans]|uniref:DUF6221 family protein n=1 Tax=Cellulosimicrobium cellulans TaxID=1710 RepID=UPI0035DC516B
MTAADALVEFLAARLDEDQVIAQAAVYPAHDGYKPHPEMAAWKYDQDEEVEYVQTPEMLAHPYPETYYVTCDTEGLTPAVTDDVGPHIARHDPARVLADVEGKRRIVSRCDLILRGRAEGMFNEGQVTDARDNLRALALPYAGHPDYDRAWAL